MLAADSQPMRAVALAVAGVAAVVVYLVAARLLRVREVTDIVATLARRGGRRRAVSATADTDQATAVSEEAIEAAEEEETGGADVPTIMWTFPTIPRTPAIPPSSGHCPRLASGHPPTVTRRPARPRTRIPW